jgi:hypothetical protein
MLVWMARITQHPRQCKHLEKELWLLADIKFARSQDGNTVLCDVYSVY